MLPTIDQEGRDWRVLDRYCSNDSDVGRSREGGLRFDGNVARTHPAGPASYRHVKSNLIHVVDIAGGVKDLGNLDCGSTINYKARHNSKGLQGRETPCTSLWCVRFGPSKLLEPIEARRDSVLVTPKEGACPIPPDIMPAEAFCNLVDVFGCQKGSLGVRRVPLLANALIVSIITSS